MFLGCTSKCSFKRRHPVSKGKEANDGQAKSLVAPWGSSVMLQEERQPFGWVGWN